MIDYGIRNVAYTNGDGKWISTTVEHIVKTSKLWSGSTLISLPRLYLRSRAYEEIRKGNKTIEVRVPRGFIRTIYPGDIINASMMGSDTKVKIESIKHYSNLRDLFLHEPLEKVCPYYETSQEAINYLKALLHWRRIIMHGVVAIRFGKV
jgi:ASC-1-like (ASCH) protein